MDSVSSTVTVAALSGGRPAETVMPAAICSRPLMTVWRALVGEGARGQLQLHLVGDDVALRAAFDVADGDDGGILGIFFAADDGLDLGDVERGEGDGIAAEWGAAPWPPMPRMTTSMEVELARAGPLRGRRCRRGGGWCRAGR